MLKKPPASQQKNQENRSNILGTTDRKFMPVTEIRFPGSALTLPSFPFTKLHRYTDSPWQMFCKGIFCQENSPATRATITKQQYSLGKPAFVF